MNEHSKEKIQWLHDAATEFASTGMKITMNPDEVLQLTTPLLALRERAEPGEIKWPAEKFCPAEYAGSLLWSETEIWNKAVEACREAYRAAMLGKPEPVSPAYKLPSGWIKCSERMPEKDGNYWAWWSESKRQGPAWFIKSELQAQFQSSEITHWMPLPAAPRKEG
ncbi:DUF551 domain-containing protein [Cronobacter turicensis]|nr:DUF551 domain-containing protein [Cronobacter turicensis]EMA1789704.1 DUF551 domain-containing protein [Cronobacter turicensis]EMA1799458.1 DUF551 domain-containing protein [Cronobacter turicensis]EMA1847920.1 DUF551 domain-containing protein [Cronobacter turicensis]EMA1857229.1 DUF551 domain-containing protein [Cronobacter turicensis]